MIVVSVLQTTGQESFVNVTLIFRPDENQQHQQQRLEQHQEVEYFYLELIEANVVQHNVECFEQHEPEVGQRETIVEYGQRVELGERGQTADCIRIVRRVGVLLKFHHSFRHANCIKYIVGNKANTIKHICDLLGRIYLDLVTYYLVMQKNKYLNNNIQVIQVNNTIIALWFSEN